MSNETQTPLSQQDSPSLRGAEDANEDSLLSTYGTNGGSGFDSVAAQYRAMQEAQLLHEETINQLREEIRGQRDRLAELSKAGPSARGGQHIDVVMLRLSELERKIGEDAPDPLINEIIHRLAALENSGPMRGMKDPRVDEVHKQLDALRQQMETAGGRDSRTDDAVLRIASLEAAFRRAAQSRDPEEVQARIDTLAEDLHARQNAELTELRSGFAEVIRSAAEAASKAQGHEEELRALTNVGERLEAVERHLGDFASGEQLSALGQQLTELDRRLAAQADNSEVEARVSALESRPLPEPVAPALDAIAARIEGLERKLEDAPSGLAPEQIEELEAKLSQIGASPEISGLRERLESLGSAVADLVERQGNGEIESRVSALESRPLPEPVAPALDAIATRIEALEQKLEDAPSGLAPEQIEELEAKLARIGASPESSMLQERLDSLAAKLAELAARGVDEEVEARVRALESRPLPESVEPALDLIAARIEGLERKLRETPSRLAPEQIEALEAKLGGIGASPEIARLRDRLESLASAVAASATSTQIEEVARRLGMIEARVENLPAGDSGSQELSERLAQLEESAAPRSIVAEVARIERELGAIQADSARSGEPVPAELFARLEEIENRISDAESSSRLEDAHARLKTIESKWDALGEPAEIGRRLTVLEMNGAPAADPRIGDLVERLLALESKPVESGSQAGLEEISSTVAELRHEIRTVSIEQLPLLADLPERLGRLEMRLRDASGSTQTGAESGQLEAMSELQGQLHELRGQIEELSSRPVQAVQDSRVSELLARIDWVERKAAESGSQGFEHGLSELQRRLERIEQTLAASGEGEGGLTPGAKAEIVARFGTIEDALAAQKHSGGGDVEALLRKETDRWNQWARSTIDEISEIREQLDNLAEGGAGARSGSGLDAESVEALGIQISHGLNNSEVKALRAQMYFVYLSIGVLWALILYILFAG